VEGKPIARRRIVDVLDAALRSDSRVLAAWLGGSDATGRTDEYSDVDLQAVAEDDFVEGTFELARRGLEALSPISLAYRLPEPTWHGHAQVFWRLRDADPHHFVDFVVQKRNAGDRLLERERHGNGVVLFDREDLLVPPPLDRVAHRKRMAERMEALRATFPLFQPLQIRAEARGHAAEAVYWYQNMALKPLVELLRMRHCPDRFDFGMRYLDRDLPPGERAAVESLAYPADPAEAERFRARVEARFAAEIAALDRGEWSLPEADGRDRRD
jgi:hypothetical protein